jgi:tRNA (cmo5U34)-methyltransferase
VAKVGDVIEAENANWQFSGEASDQFDQHIEKSVPFYLAGHDLVVGLSDFFLQQGSLGYDLGCSTGRLLATLGQRHAHKNVSLIGVDREADMVKLARGNCATARNVQIEQADITAYELEQCDLVVAFYTLQFVPPPHRQQVFDQIYRQLNWGGALIMFEKVRAPDARFQDIMSALYTDYKLGQGYSGDEIVAKARSLKGVLEPFSQAGNLGLLQRAGFVDITTVFKYVCFEGFLAIK